MDTYLCIICRSRGPPLHLISRQSSHAPSMHLGLGLTISSGTQHRMAIFGVLLESVQITQFTTDASSDHPIRRQTQMYPRSCLPYPPTHTTHTTTVARTFELPGNCFLRTPSLPSVRVAASVVSSPLLSPDGYTGKGRGSRG